MNVSDFLVMSRRVTVYALLSDVCDVWGLWRHGAFVDAVARLMSISSNFLFLYTRNST